MPVGVDALSLAFRASGHAHGRAILMFRNPYNDVP
jgi:hypothetical protein